METQGLSEVKATLPRPDFATNPNFQENKIIEKWAKLSDDEFVGNARRVLRAVMGKIRGAGGTEITAYSTVSHLLPDPNNPQRKSPLVVLPGNGCGYAESCMGCTMCNFAGEGRTPTIQDVDKAFDEIIIPHNEEFLEANHPENGKPGIAIININAVGSFFNSEGGELPKDVRLHIYKRVRDYQTQAKNEGKNRLPIFVTEARLNDVNEELLKEMRDELGDIPIEIGIGIESTDFLIREAIVNKGLPRNWEKKIKPIQKFDIEVALHTMFGTPFLDEGQAIADSVKSVRDCLKISDTVLLMIMNKKPGTLVNFLSENGQYKLPSVFSVAEAVTSLKKDLFESGRKKNLLVFGFISPKEHVESGTENLKPHDPNCPCSKVYENLLEWKTTPQNMEALERAMTDALANAPDSCPEKANYSGPHNLEEQLNPKKREGVKRKIVFFLSRAMKSLYPQVQGNLDKISDFWKPLDPEN